MSPTIEKRALQILVAIACLVPLSAGSLGVLHGPGWVKGVAAPIDLDSHFRYLSGIFLGVGIAFASCVPAIERKGPRLRMLGCFVVLGGLARLFSLVSVGVPSFGHQFGLCMELGVTPALVAWQAHVAHRIGSSSGPL